RLYGKKTKRGPKSREERDKIRSTALALGKALHAYMEYQILTGEFLAERDAADDGKIDQIAAQFELAPKEQKRLRKAIEAWNGSKLARKTRSFEHVDTEVPFYIRFADEADGAKGHKPVYFTGEIDLLCYNDTAEDPHAFIVDYKTGGEQEDSETYLKSKHRLQAHCYAYAAFERGFKNIDIEFACMEHETENGDLLSVAYHFEEADIELVKAVIYHTWKEQNDSKQRKNGNTASGTANAGKDTAQADPQAGSTPTPALGEQSNQADGTSAPASNRIILALEADFEDSEKEEVSEAIERIDRDELTPDEDQLLDDIVDASERFEGSPASAEVTFEDAEGGTSLAMLC
ncbi:MAG: PD-(D/E)XK nuclease family protein, partial [Eggerthellaceae bacterium]